MKLRKKTLWFANKLDNDYRLQSKGSRVIYYQIAKGFEEWRGRRPLTKSLVSEYLMEFGRERKYATVNIHLVVIKKLCEYKQDDLNTKRKSVGTSGRARLNRAKISEQIEELQEIRDMRSLNQGDSEKAGRMLDPEEIASMLRVCRKHYNKPKGIRDATCCRLDTLQDVGYRKLPN